MAFFRRTFHLSRMNRDADDRVLANGEYREMNNMVVMNNDGSNEAAVRKALSNKRLTNLSLGANPITLGQFSYEARNRIYWLVKSDSGCFLCEWDHNSQSASFILADTRTEGERVFDLDEDKLCTAICIIPSEDESKELMLLTDDNMPPLCFNISRARTYGVNGFDEEDILLIKRPPRYAPQVQQTYTGGKENYMEEEFLTFSYRYKYLDGYYSALSDFTVYQFAPGAFELDYQTGENLAMVNQFNAVRIGLDTGDKRVTDIQVVCKRSNSNTLFIIETFNKELKGWGHNQDVDFLFANDKRYVALPERELYRAFDNVPRLAKAMTVIGNRPVYGNYLEGYDLVDLSGNQISPQYDVSFVSNSLAGLEVPVSIDATAPESRKLVMDFEGIELNAGTSLTLAFDLTGHYDDAGDWVEDGLFTYTFSFILGNDYSNASALAQSDEWETFVNEVMTNVFMANYSLTPPADSEQTGTTGFTFTYTTDTITLDGPTITYQIDNTPGDPEDDDFTIRVYRFWFESNSAVNYRDFAVSSSCKTNRSYEVGLVYEDDYNRASTVLTGEKNTVYIPQDFSTFQNKLRVAINNVPPAYADRCKVVVKHTPLTYNTVYGIIFYEDGIYRWVKLEGANKDKVKEGDTLIVKADQNGPRNDIFKVRVLEIKEQEKDFLEGNVSDADGEISEEAGLYMKIKGDNIAMETSEAQFYYYNKSDNSEASVQMGGILQYLDEGTGDYVDLPVEPGTRIRIRFFCDPAGTSDDSPVTEFEKTFIAQGEYDNFQEWFEAEFTGYGESSGNFTITFDRNVDNNSLIIIFTSSFNPFGNDIRATVEIQLTDGIVIFETEPVVGTPEIFYSTGQEFDIVDGYHTGNIQNQDAANPAIIELDFFNCYAMGNGAECYQVKDVVNKNSLNIDLRPNTTSIEGYKAVRRIADLTYGGPFIESSNVNEVNVFNLSTGNFKDDMEKQYGPIQLLWAREGDIVVFQQEKTGKVLYGKRIITTPQGEEAIAATDKVLGDYISYQTELGIGKHPESFSVDDNGRLKYASVKQGAIVRLSNDGIEKIIYGLKGFFRDLFMSQPNAKILSGYDPYRDETVFSIGNEPVRLAEFQCGSVFSKFNQADPFSYIFKLNNLGGDIVIAYNISSGNATITATFNGVDHTASNVTGSGTLTFARTSLVENEVTVTVTPVGGAVSYILTNTCPTGSELKIISVVLNDAQDTDTTMTDRFKWGSSPFATTDELFTDPPLTRFETQTGIEGVGVFPENGGLVTIQAVKDTINSGHFATTECNRLGYLVSDIVYTEADYQDILDNPDTEFLTITNTDGEGTQTSSAQFSFNRTDTDQMLYLIWDYTSRNPVISDDSANVTQGGTVVINVLDNDEVGEGAVVTIATQPDHGTATVNVDMEIEYTHDGTDNFDDSFTYTVTENGCSSTATITVAIGVSCGDSLTASGSTGIYEVEINFGTATGWCGIQFNAQGVPDRFQMYWNDVLVDDSKYVGDNLDPGPPVSYTPTLLDTFNLSVFEYIGGSFVDTGVDEVVTIIQSDIANNTSEAIDGNGFLIFNKTAATPTTVRLRVTGPVSGTAWSILDVICPTDEVIAGEEFFAYGFFTETDKALQTKSKMLWKDDTKFYTNKFGQTNFTMYGDFASAKYINDGIDWYELDATGNIVSQGTL